MIKDTALVGLFYKEDLPAIYRMAERVRTTHNIALIDEFDSMLEQKWNDKKSYSFVEPITVSKTDDLMTNVGVSVMIDQIIGTTSVRWRYMGVGSSSTTPTVADPSLNVEILPRVDMSLFGWREPAATSLRMAAIFGESRNTETINEFGIFNAATAGNIFNHNVIAANPIAHTFNVTGYVISSVVEFLPVMP